MRTATALIACVACLAACGCAATPTAEAPAEPKPDYARPLPPGQSALRLITDKSRLPDLLGAYVSSDAMLQEAIDESLLWFNAPSSRNYFPFEQITHRQAQASLLAMRDLLDRAPPAEVFVDEIVKRFDVYESVGYNGKGTVLVTGYYSPVFKASRTPTGDFVHPLYRRPADLVTDPGTGEPQGRRMPDGSVAPYPTRREIETSGMLGGNELVWLDDALAAYIIHVNGSAKLRLVGPGEPEVMYIGYAGKTDRPYSSLAQAMIDDGIILPSDLSMATIKREYVRDPDRVTDLMHRNESYVFFTEYNGDRWPSGSLGVQVTPERTLATDKKIYPRGGLVLVDTTAITFGDQHRKFLQFMLDQDTGGAIKAPGRADIFMGIGSGAEILAGGQYAEGKLYYFFLKPQDVDEAFGQ